MKLSAQIRPSRVRRNMLTAYLVRRLAPAVARSLGRNIARARVHALTAHVAQLRAEVAALADGDWRMERGYQRVNLAVNDLNFWRQRLGYVPVSQYA